MQHDRDHRTLRDLPAAVARARDQPGYQCEVAGRLLHPDPPVAVRDRLLPARRDRDGHGHESPQVHQARQRAHGAAQAPRSHHAGAQEFAPARRADAEPGQAARRDPQGPSHQCRGAQGRAAGRPSGHAGGNEPRQRGGTSPGPDKGREGTRGRQGGTGCRQGDKEGAQKIRVQKDGRQEGTRQGREGSSTQKSRCKKG